MKVPTIVKMCINWNSCTSLICILYFILNSRTIFFCMSESLGISIKHFLIIRDITLMDPSWCTYKTYNRSEILLPDIMYVTNNKRRRFYKQEMLIEQKKREITLIMVDMWLAICLLNLLDARTARRCDAISSIHF